MCLYHRIFLDDADRSGRKPLYVIGSITCAALVSLMVTIATDRFHGPLVLVLILSYLAFFSCCIGPVFWTLLPRRTFPTDAGGWQRPSRC